MSKENVVNDNTIKKPTTEKDEPEEKEIMTISKTLEYCTLCGKFGAYINEEGCFLCNECFAEQKKEIINLYLNKQNLIPSYNQITDKIYLGNEDAARDKKLMNDLNISHILICAEGCEKFYPDLFTYKILYLDDAIDEDLLCWLKEAFDFIDSAKNNIYVHCVMGVSRSASVVIAYLMYKNKMKYDDAFDFVQSKRKEISPNTGFQRQLKQFEKILLINNYVIPEGLSDKDNEADKEDKA